LAVKVSNLNTPSPFDETFSLDEVNFYLFDANKIHSEKLPLLIKSNLHKNEQLICLQRKRLSAQKEFVASRTLIKYLLAQHYHINYQSIELSFNQQQLQLQAYNDNKLIPCTLSLAHSSGMLLFAIVKNTINNKPIKMGVDIEEVKQGRDFQALADNSFPLTECKQIQQSGILGFYRFWTLKEAFSKMLPQPMTTTLKENIQEKLADLHVKSGRYMHFDLSVVTEKAFKNKSVTVLNSPDFFEKFFPISEFENN